MYPSAGLLDRFLLLAALDTPIEKQKRETKRGDKRHTLLLADLAGLSRLVRAIYTTMTRLTTEVALASELTLNTRVLALSFGVAHFTAVETLAGALLFRAVTSKVTFLVAAEDVLAGIKGGWRRSWTYMRHPPSAAPPPKSPSACFETFSGEKSPLKLVSPTVAESSACHAVDRGARTSSQPDAMMLLGRMLGLVV